MCGRFVAASPPYQIASYFDAVDGGEHGLEPNYNVAPTEDVYAVLVDGGVRRLEELHWGLVPRWAKDPKVGNRMINARAETLATRNAFRPAFARRRCIIPADGFYEWKHVPDRKAKQPMYIHRPDGAPMAFAGLWEVWKARGGASGHRPDELRSCTIITGAANTKMAPVHDRMPIMLPPEHWATWLDPTVDDLDLLGQLLVPASPELIELWPVSSEVNDVRHQGPHLRDRLEQSDVEEAVDEQADGDQVGAA